MTPKPARRHLLRVNTVCEGDRDTVVAYYLTPKQFARRWDGLSAVRMPFAKITAAALSAVHRRGARPAAVKEMTLTSQRFPDGGWYYYWQVRVAHAGDEMRSAASEVLVDISGQMIEEQVRVFEEPNYKKRRALTQAYTDGLPPVG